MKLNLKSAKSLLARSAVLTAMVAGAIGLSFALPGHAEAAPADAKTTKQITSTITSALGGSGVSVQSVEKVDFFNDLYEVVVNHNGGKKILYTNASGSHLVLGDLMESKTMNNITEAKMDRLNAINFEKDLNQGLALKTVYGTGIRKIAVFEDPNCGYCKRFRRDALTKLQDTTVYTYMFPVLGADSTDKTKKVWCASDRTKMWDAWMLKNEAPTGEGNCNVPINDMVTLGRSMGVQGTPTVFFQDGTRASGAITATELNRRISAASR
jgi:thiol:disulfide interchange protein DsbC